MNLTPNLNGSSKEALLTQRAEVADACVNLNRLLERHFPHGRDYQLAPDPKAAHSADAAEWSDFIERVRTFFDRMHKEHDEIGGISEPKEGEKAR